MKRVLSSPDEMYAFVVRMHAVCEREDDSHKMADLTDKIAFLYEIYSSNDRTSEIFAQLSRLCEMIIHKFWGSDWMLPAVTALSRMNKFDEDNITYLRNTMRNIFDARDEDSAREFMENAHNVGYCEGCDEYEYGDHMESIGDGEQRCRVCISNNYVYSDFYGNYIYYENAVEAVNENGLRVMVSSEDSRFEYDEDDDTYYHVSYQRTPRVMGEYHSSKRNQRIIKDDWSVAKHRWLGVELEVEIRDENLDRATKALELNGLINDGEVGKRVFFERDGSLTNGIEIISQPMSLPMHHDLWQWLNNRSAVAGLRSHMTSTCGLHVHVNRDALSQLQVARIVTFINDPSNEDLIRAIARRYAEGYCRIKQKKLEDAGQSNDRYEAVNITGSNTIEFRIFKGSMKYESVVAAIEFTNSMVDFSTKFTKAEELNTSNFLNFINDDAFKETTYLRPYIANRLELA